MFEEKEGGKSIVVSKGVIDEGVSVTNSIAINDWNMDSCAQNDDRAGAEIMRWMQIEELTLTIWGRVSVVLLFFISGVGVQIFDIVDIIDIEQLIFICTGVVQLRLRDTLEEGRVLIRRELVEVDEGVTINGSVQKLVTTDRAVNVIMVRVHSNDTRRVYRVANELAIYCLTLDGLSELGNVESGEDFACP